MPFFVIGVGIGANVIEMCIRDSRKIVEKSGIRSMTSYNWSPDSKYITYVRPETTMDNIIVYHVESGEKHQVTDGWFGSSSPNFSEDGKYLVFVSARTFSPTYGRTEWNHVYNDMNKVYILPCLLYTSRCV